MSFDDILRTQFPDALDERAFARASARALDAHGFRPENTLPCVAVCRDEICKSLADEIGRVWRPPFVLSGLAGLTLAGRTGLGAALVHAPVAEGRERYLFVAGPHLAIAADGRAGVCAREGRPGESLACGALAAVLAEVREGTSGPHDDPDDLELGELRRRVGVPAADRGVGDLLALTSLAHDVIADDLERLLDEVVDTRTTDYAFLSVVQLHAPDGVNRIHARRAFAVVGGERRTVRVGGG